MIAEKDGPDGFGAILLVPPADTCHKSEGVGMYTIENVTKEPFFI